MFFSVLISFIFECCLCFLFRVSEAQQMPGDLRLVNGSHPGEGRVELYYNGRWGTVCHDGWDEYDAMVVCRQLGYLRDPHQVKVFYGAAFGGGTSDGDIWLYDVACNGSESRLVDCPASPLGLHLCNHREDAGVCCNCTEVVSTTPHPAGEVPAPGALRLVGGQHAREGRVEIFLHGEWGTVCDDGWDNNDAIVTCKNLGFYTNSWKVGAFGAAYFGPGHGTIWLDNVGCSGTETVLTACPANPLRLHDCSHSKDAGVTCDVKAALFMRTNNTTATTYTTPPHPVFAPVRLVGGRHPREGRVEILVNEKWGTVCDDGWNYTNTVVVCRQLFNISDPLHVEHYGSAMFGQGTGAILLDDMRCSGHETSLVMCPSSPQGTHNCGHSEDAGVTCDREASLNLTRTTTVRLVGGRHPREGRVEILVNGKWGTVCDDEWNYTNAVVVCRQLFNISDPLHVEHYGSAMFGEGTGAILLDNVRCSGHETSLVMCPSSPLGTHNCVHHEDAGVTCDREASLNLTRTTTATTPTTPAPRPKYAPVRLVGGRHPREGRVEILVNEKWGTVCDDGWNYTNAVVVCRQLFNISDPLHVEPYGSAMFGQGTGAILLDDVRCSGKETSLVMCPSSPLGTHNCGHSEDAGVTCDRESSQNMTSTTRATTPTTPAPRPEYAPVRLVGGRHPREGRVEIFYKGTWGTVCDDYWNYTSARVVCRQLFNIRKQW